MAVGLSQTGNKVDQENRKKWQPIPRQECQTHVGKHAFVLTHHYVCEIQTARDHQDHDQGKAHGYLVADHLG